MFILQKESFCSIQKEKKMIGHHTSVWENDDLSLWRAPAVKKNPPFFNVRAVRMCNVVQRNDLN